MSLWWKLQESSQQPLKHTLSSSQQRRSARTLSGGCFASCYSSSTQHCCYHGGWIAAFHGKPHLQMGYNHLFWCIHCTWLELDTKWGSHPKPLVTNGKLSTVSLGLGSISLPVIADIGGMLFLQWYLHEESELSFDQACCNMFASKRLLWRI